ncbi:MAG: tripartite tricarboxylate transporter permease [Pseudomonadota bacterium]
MLEQIGPAFTLLLDPSLLALFFLGVVVGMIGGALPGISASITIALLLPLAFTLDPLMSLIVLGAIYMSAEYGGSISAILINTPGTAAAVCTALDGHPMATQGRAQEALYFAIIASVIGGFIGTVVLLFFTPVLARFALNFNSPEMFWLAVAGLAIVCNLTAKNFVKGAISALIGMLIATVGYDLETGYPRFAFGITEIESGIQLVPCIIGFFAIPQMLLSASATDGETLTVTRQKGAFGRSLRYILLRPILILRSSVIGTLIGILPGAGASIASFVSYSEARRASKIPNSFSTGNPDSVVASECANNAMVGGSLVPLLAFGIPRSASAAVLFGAVTAHGMVPGARMFVYHAEIITAFMLSFIPVVICMLIIGRIGTPVFASVLKVPTAYVAPIVLILALIGSYSYQGNIVDVYITAICGILGFFLIKFGFSLPALILGLILTPMAEEGFRRTLLLSRAKGSVWDVFFSSPICIGLMILTVLMVVSAFLKERRRTSAA